MTCNPSTTSLTLSLAALLFVPLANAEGIQVNSELDESANHTSLGDLDGDGDLDLVTSALVSNAFTIFLGNGDGTFGKASQIDTALDEGAVHSSLGDLDGDGDLDLVTSATTSSAFVVHLNE